jgi:diadenosine tetraphosphate (Ap4A) HIT family hydrolase
LEYLDEHAAKIAKEKERTVVQKRQFVIEGETMSTLTFLFGVLLTALIQFSPDFKKSQSFINSCPYCFNNDKLPDTPMVSLGAKTYLALSNVTELTSGHCLIVPIQHCLTTLELDDDAWDEIRVCQGNRNHS